MNFTRGGILKELDADFYGATINRTDTGHDHAIVCYESVGGDPKAAEQFRDEVLRRLQMHDDLVTALRKLKAAHDGEVESGFATGGHPYTHDDDFAVLDKLENPPLT